MRIVLSSFLIAVSFASNSAADYSSRCEKICETPQDGECWVLGVRARTSALHFKELLSGSEQGWPSSKCDRKVSIQNSLIFSIGNPCSEYMWDLLNPTQPAKTNRTRSSIPSEFQVQRFLKSNGKPILLFTQSAQNPEFYFDLPPDNQKKRGGIVRAATFNEHAQFIIETDDVCFALD